MHGPVTAVAHPNVALVKYWGKQAGDDNVPATPSLSITLAGLASRTTVRLAPDQGTDRIVLNGAVSQDAKIRACVARLKGYRRNAPPVIVESTNDFPTAAGLASSASGFAALVTALNSALELGLDAPTLADEARRASASAARSLLGGFVALDGTQPRQIRPGQDWPLACVVAVCAETAKAVSSSAGMRASQATSPFYSRWLDVARHDFSAAHEAILNRDFATLAKVAEANCLAMHAVMLSSRPGLLYWNAATVAVLHAIRSLQADGVPVFFTIDAGPQVKAICTEAARAQVAGALREAAGVTRILQAGIGERARIEHSA